MRRHPGACDAFVDEPAFDDWAAAPDPEAPQRRPAWALVPAEVAEHEVFARPPRTGGVRPSYRDEPTERQAEYLRALGGDPTGLTRAECSEAIDRAKALKDAAPKAVRRNRFSGKCGRCGGNVPEGAGLLTGGPGAWVTTHEGECPVAVAQGPQRASEPPEGIHLHDGVVFKVQVAHQGSGRLYAKRLRPELAEDARTAGAWEYVGREPFAHLSEVTLLGLEQAKELGRLYGVCVRCGALLTDEDSIARGIGPVCAEKF